MGEVTGRQVLGVTAGAFAVIIAVNLTLAYQAIRTFPGVEVANSYVASQEFDRDRAAQEALGWTVTPRYAAGTLHLAFADAAGRPVRVGTLDVLVGRPTSARDDAQPVFTAADGGYAAPLALPPGKWMIRIDARAEGGTVFRQRLDLVVKG